ncbi:MAG: divalent-cation tolerance protein CutA [Betaproteobacteria bacterium HGW-Betaproteobacteria-11]|nr:MAG: divalent-cation tolerance protein CutA [Betaproteobacteria bacterium HGW-Betaproteobacteria-11]
METAQTLLVFTQMPDAESAEALGAALIEARLAACVNLLPAVRSIYRWRGRVGQASEVPLLIKTTAARYAALEAFVRAHHPYELPEVVAVPVTHGLAGYLAWIDLETRPETISC